MVLYFQFAKPPLCDLLLTFRIWYETEKWHPHIQALVWRSLLQWANGSWFLVCETALAWFAVIVLCLKWNQKASPSPSSVSLVKLRVLPIDVMSSSFGSLGGCLSSHEQLLFLLKLVYLLLDPDQLVLFCFSFICFWFVPILDLDLIKLSIALGALRW
jgi:hypothetical protein